MVIKQLQGLLYAELKQEIKELRDEIKQKDNKINNLEKRVTELSQTTDNLEQYSRRNSLRIFGKEESDYEDPSKLALDIIKKDLNLDIKGIDCAHRVGKKRQERKTPRPILVKFTSYADGDAVFRQRSKLKGTQIFINEDLTQVRSALLYTARTCKRNKKIKDCLTHDRLVIIKTNQNRIIGVKTEKELIDATE